MTAKGQGLPSGVRAYSTSGVVASWALFREMTIGDICAAASWGSPTYLGEVLSLGCNCCQCVLMMGPGVGVRQHAGFAFIRVIHGSL